MEEEVLFEFIGCRHPTEEEQLPSFGADIVFVYYDISAKAYMEVFADNSGSQWGQPVHILTMNKPYLEDYLQYLLEEEEGEE